jgi:hypothetical protein
MFTPTSNAPLPTLPSPNGNSPSSESRFLKQDESGFGGGHLATTRVASGLMAAGVWT